MSQQLKEAYAKARKERKKDRQNRNWKQKAKGSTPASEVNTIDNSSHGSKNRNADWPKKNLSQVTYWNYDQKEH